MKTDTDEYDFQTVQGRPIDDVIAYINEKIIREPDASVYIGVDSKVKAKSTYYAIVIGMRFPGKGVHIVHADKYGPRRGKKDYPQRLQQEIDYAVDVGLYLNAHLSKPVEVHVDINPNPIHGSYQRYNYATGYLRGTGLPFETKPNAFMAMRAADYLTYTDRY